MNDEIKIELYKLKQFAYKSNSIDMAYINIMVNKIEDYITNLQEENKFLKLNNPEMNIEHFRIIKENKIKIDRLRKENKILRENAEHNDKVVDKAKWNEMLYKQRIDKAIEYIMSNLITEWDIKNDGHVSGSDLPVDAITPILNILQGSDEE